MRAAELAIAEDFGDLVDFLEIWKAKKALHVQLW